MVLGQWICAVEKSGKPPLHISSTFKIVFLQRFKLYFFYILDCIPGGSAGGGSWTCAVERSWWKASAGAASGIGSNRALRQTSLP